MMWPMWAFDFLEPPLRRPSNFFEGLKDTTRCSFTSTNARHFKSRDASNYIIVSNGVYYLILFNFFLTK
jgi:hypothetical protein